MEKKETLAKEILLYGKEEILVAYAFFGIAFSEMDILCPSECEEPGLTEKGYEIPEEYVIRQFQKEKNKVTRTLLHGLLHYIFSHDFTVFHTKEEQKLWQAATDFVTEDIAMELMGDDAGLSEDSCKKEILKPYKEKVRPFTAELLYDYLRENPGEVPGEKTMQMFALDGHGMWNGGAVSKEEKTARKKVGTKIKNGMEMSAREKKDSSGLMQNLRAAVREKQSYAEFLRRFASPVEERKLSEEEMDLVYYTYGLSLFGNVPLVEPLEYSENRKIRDFVIAIDTSGSTAGRKVQIFLDKTYSVLKTSERFSEEICIHILQCDDRVQKDTVIRSREDLDKYIQGLTISGYGGTDFRPVFSHVEMLREKGELQNLKGLLYFTDGRGIYPSGYPGYPAAFVFTSQSDAEAPVPAWAMKVYFEEENPEEAPVNKEKSGQEKYEAGKSEEQE